MTSTVTNYSNLINPAYPIAGQANNTQGFRDNFTAIQQAFTATANEITALQSITSVLTDQTAAVATLNSAVASLQSTVNGVNLLELQNEVSTLTDQANAINTLTSLITGLQASAITQINGILTATNITAIGFVTATNIYANGTVYAKQFIGDGSLLTNLPAPSVQNITSIKVSEAVYAKSVNVTGNITGKFFIGDGSQLSNVSIKPPTAVGVLSTLTVAGTGTFIDIYSSGNINSNNITISGVLNVSNISASAITGSAIQASTFVTNTINASGTIAGQTFTGNSGQLTTLILDQIILNDTLDTTTATISASSSSIIISNANSIHVLNTSTIVGTLTNWFGNLGTISTDTQLTVTLSTITNVSFIGTGTTQFNSFKLWSGDPIFHSINTITNSGTVLSIITDPFDITNANNSGVKLGSNITFYKTTSPIVSLYATTAPLTSKGQPGDKQGMIFADSSFIYVCTSTYTTGTVDIWTKSAVVSQPW
jgi:hypothetical protein